MWEAYVMGNAGEASSFAVGIGEPKQQQQQHNESKSNSNLLFKHDLKVKHRGLHKDRWKAAEAEELGRREREDVYNILLPGDNCGWIWICVRVCVCVESVWPTELPQIIVVFVCGLWIYIFRSLSLSLCECVCVCKKLALILIQNRVLFHSDSNRMLRSYSRICCLHHRTTSFMFVMLFVWLLLIFTQKKMFLSNI